MRSESLTLMVVILTLFSSSGASAKEAVTENVIYYFNGQSGAYPYNGMIVKGGSLFGVTYAGGIYENGTVFELAPNGDSWTETVLYNFMGGSDGALPYSDLTVDSDGNFYGTTWIGGVYGGGVVFELSPSSQGGWTETVLHSFRQGPRHTSAGLSRMVLRGGNLYGTVYSEEIGFGAVFELKKSKQGWSKKTLYNFTGGDDGEGPSGGLAFDASGNLYGTAQAGGTGASGVVFELTPSGTGWNETTLYRFQCCNGDGVVPQGVTISKAGDLFGTTSQGGTGICKGYYGCGTVWELSQSSAGWTETVLHNFTGGSDGDWPNADLLVTPSAIFGTDGGALIADATVFQLTPSSNGWTNTVLLDLGVGGGLFGGVVKGPGGNLYGTVSSGGQNYGYVFRLTH